MSQISLQSSLPLLIILLSRMAIAAPETVPNVLLIITDEHNFRTLGCYRELLSPEQAEMWGKNVVVPTPHLDRLAKEGVLCTRAYATAPVCSPCRAAMITGRYPHATGVPTNNLVLDRSVPTLADRLNQAGYRTAFVGKWHLGGTGKPEWAPKVDGGFQFTKYMFNRGHWKQFDIRDGQPVVGAQRNGVPTYDVTGADNKTFATDWLTDRALEYITDTEATKPFFTVISYPDPHGPNTVRSPYDHRFDHLRFAPPRTYKTGVPPPEWIGGQGKHPVFRGADMSRYFGMVQCIDDNIGRLLARMKDANCLNNTLIVMTSDHGDLCYEHDRQNKGNPYEGSARVPMILRLPGRIATQQVYAQPVGTVDLTPTVMGLLNLPGDPNDQGRDLSAVLANVSQATGKDEKNQITFLRNAGQGARWVAAVDARYKLILSVNDDPWLFDAEQDPDELLNFYRRPGTEGVAERLGKALRDYGNSTQDPFLRHDRIEESLARVLGESKDEKEKNEKSVGFNSRWQGSRRWIGPDWWANPITDWSMRGGTVIASAAADRTLCVLPVDVATEGEYLEMSVEVEASGKLEGSGRTAAGFRLGRRGGIDDFRHSLVHATNWIDAKIRADGHLQLGESQSKKACAIDQGPVALKLAARRDGNSIQLTFTATRANDEISITESFNSAEVAGGISLLSDGPSRPGGAEPRAEFAFRDFSIKGDLLRKYDNRSFGPILWSQYTLSEDRLRLQAQFAPLGPRPNHKAELWTSDATGESKWTRVATVPLKKLSRTATFTVDDWPSHLSKRYQVRFRWRGEPFVWEGQVRREPINRDQLTLGCFSCDNGYLFPIPAMVTQVLRQDPDIVFFAGDQIYENYGGFGVARNAETATAMIDYLRKYYQFGWTWREVLRDRPSVILPDDHDVFQGNLWGHGGRCLPKEANDRDWTWGGYLMPGEWVNAVEQTQVGHLPDPADEKELPIGIRPYYTRMTYAGVGFAILEDRKFKTGPKSIPVDRRADGDRADLLGDEQEAFLRSWAKDWDGQQMKCALSQTIFCTAATHAGRNLKRTRSYFDSGAWPKAARNRAVRILGDCNALAIHGDQHLGILLRHGIQDFDDAGYAFMIPGTANGFPRAWWPGTEKELPQPGQQFTGKFHDDAGHPIHVLAVGNPDPGSNHLPRSDDPLEVGLRKGSGYGIVQFNKDEKTADVALYRLGNENEMFSGFPQTIKIGGKP